MVCKEDIPILGSQNSRMFWLFHGLHERALPRSETGPILTIYVIRDMENVMVLQFVEILQFSKVLISLVQTQFNPI